MRTIQATSHPTHAIEQVSPSLLGLLTELAGTAVRALPGLGDRY